MKFTEWPPFWIGTARRHAVRICLTVFISVRLSPTAVAQLEWDPNGPPTGAQGGSGDWLGRNGGTPWWNGLENVAWFDGGDATFGTGSGTVVANGVIVD